MLFYFILLQHLFYSLKRLDKNPAKMGWADAK